MGFFCQKNPNIFEIFVVISSAGLQLFLRTNVQSHLTRLLNQNLLHNSENQMKATTTSAVYSLRSEGSCLYAGDPWLLLFQWSYMVGVGHSALHHRWKCKPERWEFKPTAMHLLSATQSLSIQRVSSSFLFVMLNSEQAPRT